MEKGRPFYGGLCLCHFGPIDAFFHDPGQFFETVTIHLIETIGNGAVYIQYPDNAPLHLQRDHDFGLRCGVTGDMAGELANVRHKLSGSLLDSGAADSLSDGDPDTGGQS